MPKPARTAPCWISVLSKKLKKELEQKVQANSAAIRQAVPIQRFPMGSIRYL